MASVITPGLGGQEEGDNFPTAQECGCNFHLDWCWMLISYTLYFLRVLGEAVGPPQVVIWGRRKDLVIGQVCGGNGEADKAMLWLQPLVFRLIR